MGTNTLTAIVAIRGTRPLLWHTFGPDTIALERKERTGVAGNDPQEWKRSHSATKEGQLYLAPSYVFGTIRDGARQIKKGRGSIQASVAATLQVLDNLILVDRWLPREGDPPMNDPEAPVYIDVRSAVNPTTKRRNVRYRVAASPGWQCSFSIQWDATLVSRGEMQSAVIQAGMFSGLGDGRAIGMGRFEVISWELQE